MELFSWLSRKALMFRIFSILRVQTATGVRLGRWVLPFGRRACANSLGPPMTDNGVSTRDRNRSRGDGDKCTAKSRGRSNIRGVGLRHKMGGEQVVAKQKYDR